MTYRDVLLCKDINGDHLCMALAAAAAIPHSEGSPGIPKRGRKEPDRKDRAEAEQRAEYPPSTIEHCRATVRTGEIPGHGWLTFKLRSNRIPCSDIIS